MNTPNNTSEVFKAHIVIGTGRNDGCISDLVHRVKNSPAFIQTGTKKDHERKIFETITQSFLEHGIVIEQEEDRDMLCGSTKSFDSYDAFRKAAQAAYEGVTGQVLTLHSHPGNLNVSDDYSA